MKRKKKFCRSKVIKGYKQRWEIISLWVVS
ncbi:hypothetical protein Goklo_025396 [Gossypium klotzschianum]|uniref:Uncharacterized protein n=1 Tax=Gossypium klotzschianum TaxID=34286 RepID=A0A7J8W9A1_9ROSI|nr:hypothetical protein [Gossypium klotzschianum]